MIFFNVASRRINDKDEDDDKDNDDDDDDDADDDDNDDDEHRCTEGAWGTSADVPGVGLEMVSGLKLRWHCVIANRYCVVRFSYFGDCHYNKNKIRYNTYDVHSDSENTLSLLVAP